MDTTDISSLPVLLNSMGMTSASGGLNWPDLMGSIVFSIIGFVVFSYGRREKAPKPFAIGLVLMVFPYFAPGTIWLYAIGIGLCALLYYWRD